MSQSGLTLQDAAEFNHRQQVMCAHPAGDKMKCGYQDHSRLCLQQLAAGQSGRIHCTLHLLSTSTQTTSHEGCTVVFNNFSISIAFWAPRNYVILGAGLVSPSTCRSYMISSHRTSCCKSLRCIKTWMQRTKLTHKRSGFIKLLLAGCSSACWGLKYCFVVV